MATSQSLTNAITEHQIDVVKFETGQAKTLDPFIKAIEKYLKQRILEEGDTIISKTKLNVLLKDVKAYLDGEYSAWFDEYFTPMMQPFIDEEVDFTAMAVGNVTQEYTPIKPSVEQVTKAVYANPLILNNSAVDFGMYTKNWKPNEIKRVAGRISAGFYAGETTQSIVQGLVGKSRDIQTNGTKKGSIMNMSRANIYSMVKTSITHMSSEAKKEFAKDNNDLIIGERWISTLDTKTSSICKDRDQEVYLYADGGHIPRPPAHIGCRSTMSYDMDDDFAFLKDNKTRPAITEDVDGKAYAEQVPAKQSYYTWLKSQPAAVQDKALGKERGLIFRNAGLSPEEFKAATTNQFGQEITLDQLRKNNQKIDDYMKRQEA